MDTITTYKYHIYSKYKFLKNSNKCIDNYDLCKIFEYYTCIILFEKCNKIFYQYDEISPDYKEINNLSKQDTGIDFTDLVDTIGQCKLRKHNLTWRECSTFFSSCIGYNEITNEKYIKWLNLILCRNSECILSNNLQFNNKLFTDIPIDTDEFIKYCDNLYDNPPVYTNVVEDFVLRNYQVECINLINNTNNVVINLPTGTGKNVIIINSLNIENNKYLILVPRKVLMYQLYDEILKFKPQYKFNIQLIGDNRTNFNETKNITICIYNSINKITNFDFTKIFIDEAHHIYTPIIYCNDEQIIEENIIETDDDIIYLEPQDFSDYIEPSEYSDDETSETESEFNEDTTDVELYNNKKYINIISDLCKYKNNVYLSATIDEITNFEYYKQDIRDMINNKYLCDYNINVPIFSENANNTDICNYLISNYKYIIIYCNSISEGQSINNTLNIILPNCSQYLDYKTSKSNVNKILNKYKSGDLLFLVNVRILIEGFDAPITNGVCFLHMPGSKTNAIQIIGRALRLHPLKSIANVILPYSRRDDEKDINKFLNILANNDSRIKKSYNNKKLGGYINISVESVEENETESDENNFIHNKIYNSLGEPLNDIEYWYKKYNELLEYIIINNKIPSSGSKDKIVTKLGRWYLYQNKNYKNKTYLMKNQKIYNKWTELLNRYKKFIYKPKNNSFNVNYNLCIEYIEMYNKLPARDNHNLYKWICRIKKKYNKNKLQNKYKHLWRNLIEKYKKVFNDFINKLGNNTWIENYNLFVDYIKKYNNLPADSKIDNSISILYSWMNNNKNNYEKNKMKDEHKILWESLIKNYKDLFNDFINKPKRKTWIENYNLCIEYIKKYNNLPYSKTNKELTNLYGWLKQNSYRYKENKLQHKYKHLWEQIIEKNKDLLLILSKNKSKHNTWKENYNLFIDYLKNYNKLPTTTENYLYLWMNRSKNQYKRNKIQDKYKRLWEELINGEYKHLFDN
jgi:superfamily II DNA or RNA helicase